jgi:hypothetical protein
MKTGEYFKDYTDQEKARSVWEEYAEDIKKYHLNKPARRVLGDCRDSSSLASGLASMIRGHENNLIVNALSNSVEDLDFDTD